MNEKGSSDSLLYICVFMLIVGIIIYKKAIVDSKDSDKLKESHLNNNFNNYMKSKGLILIIISILFSLFYLGLFLMNRL